jgi:hypothetical protein
MGWLMNTAESDCCSNGRCVAAVFLDTDVTSRIAARCRPVSRIDHGARRSDGCLQRGSRFLLFRSGSDLNNEVPAGEGMRVFDVFALLCKMGIPFTDLVAFGRTGAPMIRLYGIGLIATACWASLWKSNPRACERNQSTISWKVRRKSTPGTGCLAPSIPSRYPLSVGQ